MPQPQKKPKVIVDQTGAFRLFWDGVIPPGVEERDWRPETRRKKSLPLRAERATDRGP